ncbi:MAG: hypothetical protein GY865_00775, partial [candidate division Zixibacteria bacterium]|nr:hypothetical protein [candidate division Zixibacteria bacterium]
MTNGQKKLPFTQLMVSIMPKKQGIYTLWNRSGKVIFIGIANKPNSLYNELKHHFDSKHSVSIDGIYDFQVNVCNNPEDMQKQLLTVHKNDHGYLPDYN